MGIIRRNIYRENRKKAEELKATSSQNQAYQSKELAKGLLQAPAQGASDMDRLIQDKQLQVEQSKVDVLKKELVAYESKARRGRPQKPEDKKYGSNRKKFTAMLLKENLSFLLELKRIKKIKDISSFLDQLIEGYRASM